MRLPYNDATKFCKDKGLQLLTINTSKYNRGFNKYAAFQAFYNQMFKNLEVFTFLGIRNDGPNTPWRLITGEPFGYSFDWASGEPNNPTTEFCMSVKREPNTDQFGFNDLYCTQSWQFLCEEPLDYDFVDSPGFSSLLSVTYKARTTSCNAQTIGIVSRRANSTAVASTESGGSFIETTTLPLELSTEELSVDNETVQE